METAGSFPPPYPPWDTLQSEVRLPDSVVDTIALSSADMWQIGLHEQFLFGTTPRPDEWNSSNGEDG